MTRNFEVEFDGTVGAVHVVIENVEVGLNGNGAGEEDIDVDGDTASLHLEVRAPSGTGFELSIAVDGEGAYSKEGETTDIIYELDDIIDLPDPEGDERD